MVTVFRHVPPPIIGMCGVMHDRVFETFEEHLDWLDAMGVLVERFDPASEPGAVNTRPEAGQALESQGDRCLPLILSDDEIVSSGTHLSRSQLAHAVGFHPQRSAA